MPFALIIYSLISVDYTFKVGEALLKACIHHRFYKERKM